MGRTASGQVLARFGCAAAAFLCAHAVFAQSAPQPVHLEEAPPAPAAEPAPATGTAGPETRRAAPPPAAEPVPLEPSIDQEPPKRPSFLHTREELERIDKAPTTRGRRRARAEPSPQLDDFVSWSTPWVDLTLTSFYFDDRVGNFLNLGVQAGGYLFERLRVSARIVAPLEEVTDNYGRYGIAESSFGFGTGMTQGRVPSRSMTLLYGASVGLIISNDRSFVFGPSLSLLRTDVEDYGSAVALSVPFEWTTGKNLRVGFELSLGQAVGGRSRSVCRAFSGGITTSCGNTVRERPGGTAVVFQFYMGWSLGRL